MKLKVKIPNVTSDRFWLWASFLLSILIETLVQSQIISDSTMTKIIQYFVILIPIGLCLSRMLFMKGRGRKFLFADELKLALVMIGILFMLSMYRSITAGQFTFRSIMELIQIVLPFAFTYVMINNMSVDNIDTFAKIALFATIFGYFFCSLRKGVNFFSLDNYLSISFLTSYSAFEDSTFAELASGLSAYFIYNRKKRPVYTFLVIVLNFLIFKRVLMLMVAILLVVSARKDCHKKISRKWVILTTIFWILLICLCYFFYLPDNYRILENFLHIDLASFTMARVYRIWYMLENNFTSYGLGSTSTYISSINVSYIGHEFEMDFIRIMFEIGPIAISAIVYVYLRITKGDKYSYYLVNCCFLNLLMANGIVRYWGWTMRTLTIALINYSDQMRSRYHISNEKTL